MSNSHTSALVVFQEVSSVQCLFLCDICKSTVVHPIDIVPPFTPSSSGTPFYIWNVTYCSDVIDLCFVSTVFPMIERSIFISVVLKNSLVAEDSSLVFMAHVLIDLMLVLYIRVLHSIFRDLFLHMSFLRNPDFLAVSIVCVLISCFRFPFL